MNGSLPHETVGGARTLHPTPPTQPNVLLAAVVMILGAAACGKSAPSAAAKAAESGAPDAAPVMQVPATEPLAQDLWDRAKENVANGDGDDLARLADREGMRGILARANDPAWRITAIRAMGYVDGFEQLPWLVEVARGANNDDASAALDVIADMAARPRRAVDPEDAAELKQGCDSLLAMAKDAQSAKPRRIVAIRALRMLSERGCVASADIPADLDVH